MASDSRTLRSAEKNSRREECPTELHESSGSAAQNSRRQTLHQTNAHQIPRSGYRGTPPTPPTATERLHRQTYPYIEMPNSSFEHGQNSHVGFGVGTRPLRNERQVKQFEPQSRFRRVQDERSPQILMRSNSLRYGNASGRADDDFIDNPRFLNRDTQHRTYSMPHSSERYERNEFQINGNFSRNEYPQQQSGISIYSRGHDVLHTTPPNFENYGRSSEPIYNGYTLQRQNERPQIQVGNHYGIQLPARNHAPSSDRSRSSSTLSDPLYDHQMRGSKKKPRKSLTRKEEREFTVRGLRYVGLLDRKDFGNIAHLKSVTNGTLIAFIHDYPEGPEWLSR